MTDPISRRKHPLCLRIFFLSREVYPPLPSQNQCQGRIWKKRHLLKNLRGFCHRVHLFSESIESTVRYSKLQNRSKQAFVHLGFTTASNFWGLLDNHVFWSQRMYHFDVLMFKRFIWIPYVCMICFLVYTSCSYINSHGMLALQSSTGKLRCHRWYWWNLSANNALPMKLKKVKPWWTMYKQNRL